MQLPLTMMADEFLDALKDGLISIQEITRVYVGFREFYTVHIAERQRSDDILSNALSDNAWVIVQAERAMSYLIQQMTTPRSLAALRCGEVFEKNWGPKAELRRRHPEFIEALESERITELDVQDMSYAELCEAISENRYPQDSSHSYS